MKKTGKKIIIAISVLVSVLCLFLWSTVHSDVSPPNWEESHLVFKSDDEMVSYCDCLFFNTTGLRIVDSYRCLEFVPGEFGDKSKWIRLDVFYAISDGTIASSDRNEFSMTVYFEELNESSGFPVRNTEIQNMVLNGIPIEYHEFEDKKYSFRALFHYGGYTYEVTVYSPEDPDILLRYLERLVPLS